MWSVHLGLHGRTCRDSGLASPGQAEGSTAFEAGWRQLSASVAIFVSVLEARNTARRAVRRCTYDCFDIAAARDTASTSDTLEKGLVR